MLKNHFKFSSFYLPGSTVTRPLRRNITTGRIETERTPLLSNQESSDDSGTFPRPAVDVVSSKYLEVSHEHDSNQTIDRAERGSMSTIGSFNTSCDGGDRTSRKSFNVSMNNYVADFTDSNDVGRSETSSTRKTPVSAGNISDTDITESSNVSGTAEGQLIDFASETVGNTNGATESVSGTQVVQTSSDVKDDPPT